MSTILSFYTHAGKGMGVIALYENISSNARVFRREQFTSMLLMIGCIPLAMAVVALAIYSGISMKNELEENTYERLKACPISVQQYFEYH